MSTIKQAVIIILMIAYLLLPIDLIPDIAIGPGQIDDIIVIIIGIVKLFKYRNRVGENAEEQIKGNSEYESDDTETGYRNDATEDKRRNNQGNQQEDYQEDKIIDVDEYTITDVENQ